MKLEPEALEQIAKIVRDVSAVPVERRHWDIATISAYHGKAVSTIRSTITCLKDFPKPIKIDENDQPRWVAGEVMEWFEARKV